MAGIAWSPGVTDRHFLHSNQLARSFFPNIISILACSKIKYMPLSGESC